MDDDCFVKYFLQQAAEIEPETIQALIDNGYRTKLSLCAMDLLNDLPLIEDISLSQRSLLRKYISAFQTNNPFVINLTGNPFEVNEVKLGFPNKKRKYSAIANSFAETDRKSLSPINSPKAKRIDVNSVNWANDVKSTMNESLTKDNSFNDSIINNDKSINHSTPRCSSVKVNRRKDTPYPTPSQIRYHKMMQTLAEIEKNDLSEISPEPKNTIVPKNSNVSFAKNLSTTNVIENRGIDIEMRDESSYPLHLSRIINSSIVQNEPEEPEDVEPQPKVGRRVRKPIMKTMDAEPVIEKKKSARVAKIKKDPEPKTSVMTPAERAVRAKIEAKKAGLEKKKTNRKRK